MNLRNETQINVNDSKRGGYWIHLINLHLSDCCTLFHSHKIFSYKLFPSEANYFVLEPTAFQKRGKNNLDTVASLEDVPNTEQVGLACKNYVHEPSPDFTDR